MDGKVIIRLNEQDVKNFPRINDIKVQFLKPENEYETKPIEYDTATAITNESDKPTAGHKCAGHKFPGEYELHVKSKRPIKLVARTPYGYKAEHEFTIPPGKA